MRDRGREGLMTSMPAPSEVDTDSRWHRSPIARNLLDRLSVADVRLVLSRGGPGPDALVWHPASALGATTFDALASLRAAAVETAFVMACTGRDRAHALAAAQRAPSVAGAVCARFGDPGRWLGFGPIEATRRFRANGPH